MKQISLIFSMVLLMFSTVMAQKTVTGTVTDDSSEPLIGANVSVKGTDKGTITEFDGTYSIMVSEGEVLIFSYTGYEDQERTVGAESTIDVALSEGVVLTTAVVTALGISREEKSLGYAVTKVDGSDLTQAREANLVNALSGKVAGAQITNSSGAVGSSSRVVLRGATSITGNNQALFVVDGVPVNNGTLSNGNSGGGFETPNGIADINPDDIESITVLKGPNAAALYGSQASRGVIVITTKSGSKRKGIGISFNSTTSFETPLVLPDFQNSYGQGGNQDYFEWVDGSNSDGGVDESWGPALDAGLEFVQWNSFLDPESPSYGAPLPWVSQPDNIKDFYDTGVTANNNLSFSGGNETATFRLGLGMSNQKGMVPNTDFTKYNVSGNSNVKLGEKVTAGLSVSYVKSKSDNLPTGGYNGENPVQQMIWSGRNVDFAALKDYENLPLAAVGTAAEGTPINWNTLFQNNPYWVLDNNLNKMNKDRVLGSATLGYEIMDGLSLRGKSSMDHYNSLISVQKAKGSNQDPEGYYQEQFRRYSVANNELLLSFSRDLNEDVSIGINLGGNMLDGRSSVITGTAPQLELAGVYNLSNVKSGVNATLSNSLARWATNSIYTFGQIGYKRAVYLDFTLRNDWDSRLPEDNNSFLYPSVTVSTVLSDLIDMPNDVVSYLKVRGGWSKVGGVGGLGVYALQQTYDFRGTPWGSVSMAYNPSQLNNPNITPEFTSGIEFGIDGRFLKDRVRLDLTYYNQNSKDLIIPVEVSAATGYTSSNDNVADMKNQGVEIQLGTTPYKNKDWKIDVDFNFAKNKNEVTDLGENTDALVLGGQWNVDLQARVGQPYGVLFGPAFERTESGDIIYEDGLPVISGDYKVLGNIQPDWTGGVNVSVKYKGLGLSTLIDMKKGGSIYSMTTTWGRYAGVLEETLLGRETGVVGDGVMMGADGTYIPNDIVVSAESFNKRAYSNSVAESAVFDATYVKWRQMMLSYSFPSSWLEKTPFQSAEIAFVGRNLAILKRNSPHIDPESAFSSSNGQQGQEFGQLPSARSMGFNIKFSF